MAGAWAPPSTCKLDTPRIIRRGLRLPRICGHLHSMCEHCSAMTALQCTALDSRNCIRCVKDTSHRLTGQPPFIPNTIRFAAHHLKTSAELQTRRVLPSSCVQNHTNGGPIGCPWDHLATSYVGGPNQKSEKRQRDARLVTCLLNDAQYINTCATACAHDNDETTSVCTAPPNALRVYRDNICNIPGCKLAGPRRSQTKHATPLTCNDGYLRHVCRRLQFGCAIHASKWDPVGFELSTRRCWPPVLCCFTPNGFQLSTRLFLLPVHVLHTRLLLTTRRLLITRRCLAPSVFAVTRRLSPTLPT